MNNRTCDHFRQVHASRADYALQATHDASAVFYHSLEPQHGERRDAGRWADEKHVGVVEGKRHYSEAEQSQSLLYFLYAIVCFGIQEVVEFNRDLLAGQQILVGRRIEDTEFRAFDIDLEKVDLADAFPCLKVVKRHRPDGRDRHWYLIDPWAEQRSAALFILIDVDRTGIFGDRLLKKRKLLMVRDPRCKIGHDFESDDPAAEAINDAMAENTRVRSEVDNQAAAVEDRQERVPANVEWPKRLHRFRQSKECGTMQS